MVSRVTITYQFRSTKDEEMVVLASLRLYLIL